MRALDEPAIRARLSRLSARIRLWRLLTRLGWVGAVAIASPVAFLGLWQRGAIERPAILVLLVMAVLLGAVLTAVVLLVLTLAKKLDPQRLAARLESANPSLLDRFHTVIAREAAPDAPELAAPDSYYERIQRQILAAPHLADPPLSDLRRRGLVALAALAVATVATIAYLKITAPWEAAARERSRGGAGVEAPEIVMPLEQPPALVAEEELPVDAWGEVRIVEPGRDLRVTKVDVVPLRIEVSTEDPIGEAAYLTSRTGETAVEHGLGAPTEPTFATYKPILYVDEFELSDWDVMAYHATSSTRTGESFASDVYFLEIRPFREELLQAESGDGSGYQALNRLTGLIDEQKRVVRQLNRHLHDAERSVTESDQDRRKLAEAEGELAEATRHLYAEMAADENTAIGTALDHLALAEEWLTRTADEISVEAAGAPTSAQRALAELVQARKDVQKVVGGAGSPEASGGEPDPYIEDIVREITEFRDEAEAARESVEEIARSVRETAAAAGERGPEDYPDLADEQQPAQDALGELGGDHPGVAKRLASELDRAERALEEAQESLRRGEPEARERQADAASAIERLRRAIARDGGAEDLEDAYRLKELLDDQVERLGELESSESDPDGESAARAARDASRVVEALDETLGQPGMDGVFSPELERALEGRSRRRIDDALERLERAAGGDERRQAAGESRAELERLSSTFDESAPELARELRERDPLGAPESGSVGDLVRHLESLLARAGDPDGREALRGEILSLLGRMEVTGGADADEAELLARLRRQLESGEELDDGTLGDLVAALQLAQMERAAEGTEEIDPGELAHIELDALPPSYRRRIERYLRELSESQ